MIAAEDIVYARLAAPDLDAMERCLVEFGLQRARRTDHVLHMRGHGPNPVIHVTERGPPRHIGFALKAQCREDLDRLADENGTRPVARDEPGGGVAVHLTDPDGNRVEIVHGLDVTPASASRKTNGFNLPGERPRINEGIRLRAAPSHVMRLGHVALHARDFPGMYAFYRDVLGMRLSDSYFAGNPGNTIVAFMHCGLGDRLTDHHSIALIGDGRTGFDHLGFEVLDLDDLMMGNRHLIRAAVLEHSWGVGRHRDGSQIFDYWRDPLGLKIEHWTDGDFVNDAYQSSETAFSPAEAGDALAQWGPPFNPDFMR